MDKLKCVNCSGTHSIAYTQYPKNVETQQALQVRPVRNVTFREATQKVREERPRTATETSSLTEQARGTEETARSQSDAAGAAFRRSDAAEGFHPADGNITFRGEETRRL